MIFKDIGKPLVKICGIQTTEAAQTAIDEGAMFLGVICVPNRNRTVNGDIAKEISMMVRVSREKRSSKGTPGPYLVGVFRNQTVEDIIRTKDEYGLDIVQLHGSENWADYHLALGETPLIKRFLFPDDCPAVLELCQDDQFRCLPLFDSEAGGTGEKLDWKSISQWSQKSNARFILAGGLSPLNVSDAVRLPGVLGVDVSGGVETDGLKDEEKIRQFIANATT